MSATPTKRLLIFFLLGLLAACAAPGPVFAPAGSPDPSSGSAKPVVVALVSDAQQAQQQGRHEQAASYLERALRIEPNNPDLWHRLARVRYAQGRFQQSLNFAAKSNALTGADQALQRRNWYLIADAWLALGQKDKAEAARRKAQQ